MTIPLQTSQAAPGRRSTRGARILTAVGALFMIGALVVAFLSARTFVGLLPVDVLDGDGEPGPAVLLTVPAPGTGEVTLDAGTDYALFTVVDAQDSDSSGADDVLDAEVAVTGPDGTAVEVRGSADVDMSTGGGGRHASTVGSFETDAAGTYTVIVPAAQQQHVEVLVTQDQPVLPFVGGIFGTIAGAFAAVLLGILGVGMLIGGVVWWVLRRRSA
ncbi:hypothetical protein [Actinotalea subterranea]|uniref:hypothetical protein n=1 Tax=Actinotalea subterranea TaxID=2607497 RepID=UPI0011EC0939|nr:hypothetical protein [Actinotalea subterranea]